MPTEADTCRKYVTPKLYAAGWNDDQINEQRTFTDGAGNQGYLPRMLANTLRPISIACGTRAGPETVKR